MILALPRMGFCADGLSVLSISITMLLSSIDSDKNGEDLVCKYKLTFEVKV